MKVLNISIITVILLTNSIANDLLSDKSLEELLNIEAEAKVEIGSRSGNRDITLAEVPIDVITSKELQRAGFKDLNRILQKYVAGFNAPRPAVNDGSDHLNPFTLRGLNPDQVLVLINGKRVHTTALMHINGTIGRGASGVDLSKIPISAIDKIEILRDGAAAQYGSDAIAGVINIILKGYGHQSKFSATSGISKEGDGEFYQSDMFYITNLKYDGFISIFGDIKDKNPTNRAGVDKRYEVPIVSMKQGEPDVKDFSVGVNIKAPQESGNIYYLRTIINKKDSANTAYIRRDVDERNNIEIYPNGFLPVINPKIFDNMVTFGVSGVTNSNIEWDISNNFGYNQMKYFIKNSLNHSLGLESPKSFFAGELDYLQNSLNLDLLKKIDKLNIAGGFEFRYENFKIKSGEEASYIVGDYSKIGGSQGFYGFRNDNATNEDRQNYASYLDLKYQMTEKFLINGAMRYEYYSDFKDTLDAKVALSHKTTNSLMLRASLSSGFRAPSLSQNYFNATATNFFTDDNKLYESGTLRVNDELAKALGAKDLKPEESLHSTLGFVYKPISNLSFMADYFQAKIDDRIILSEEIDVDKVLENAKIKSARFFTNAISTELYGVDLKLNYNYEFEDKSKLTLGAWFNYAKNEITSINDNLQILGEDAKDIIIGNNTKTAIEVGQPKDSIKLLSNYEIDKFNFALNVSRYGSFQDNFTTPTIYKFNPKWVSDFDISYSYDKNINFGIGAENIFDVYPDKFPKTDNPFYGDGSIFQYSNYSPFGFSGALYYVRLEITF